MPLDVAEIFGRRINQGQVLRRSTIEARAPSRPDATLESKRTLFFVPGRETFAEPDDLDAFLAPALAADYDAEAHLVVTPGWLVPARGGRAERLIPLAAATPESPSEGGFGRDDAHGGAWRLLEPVPAPSRGWFEIQSQRVFAGDEIPDVLARLRVDPLFRPTARVAITRVFEAPALGKVRLGGLERGWLDLDASYFAGPHEVALAHVIAAAGSTWLRIGDDFVRAPRGELIDIAREALSNADLGDATAFAGCVRVPAFEYLRLRARADAPFDENPQTPAARGITSLNGRRPALPAPLPRGYTGVLRPYQRAGLDWLWALREAGLGGVLADEMGLGKTHMTLALLAACAESGDARGPSLVVAPTSVVGPWIEKARAFAPGLDARRYEGKDRARLLEGLSPRSVVVTTYGVMVRDMARLKVLRWEAVLLDEAHRVKNAETDAARAARQLNARVRIAVTGTPVENRPGELFSLFDFALPGYLGPRVAQDALERRITAGDSEAAEDLRRLVRPFTLRRRKRDVLPDMPAKRDATRICELSDDQSALYREVLDGARRELLPGIRDERKRIDFIPILAALTRLKRICDHPALALTAGADARSRRSGKLEVLLNVLESALAADRKVVVFTQYVAMMDIIEEELASRAWNFADLRGSTRDRDGAIARFQGDPSCRVMVVSLLAGGLGIDLTSGSVVVHYDRWWNAAREDQATDRVHRLGQRADVDVVRLITRGTLEERIDALIARKARLLDDLVEADGSPPLRSLEREEIADLFG